MRQFVVALCLTALAATVAGQCGDSSWSGIHTSSGLKCYKFSNDTLVTWHGAQSLCHQWGGKLATINSPDELIIVNGLRVTFHRNTGNLWIGLKKLGNKFYWMANNYQTIREINSDEASNWWPGKPDEQGDTQRHSGFCGYMWAARGLHVNWDDQYCSQHYNFICQKDM